MLKADQILFVELPGDGGGRVLHPGVVVEVSDDRLRVESPAIVSVSAGDGLEIYFEQARTFVRQPCEVSSVCSERGRFTLELWLVGDPVSAEKRTSLRVSTAGMGLHAEFAGEADCEVLDVSEVGFSLSACVVCETGTVVDVVLIEEDRALAGTVLLQSVTGVGEGRTRYGVRCVDGPLKFALAGVNLKVQRQQIRRGKTHRPRP